MANKSRQITSHGGRRVSPARVDWSQISPVEFEEFCGRLLELKGFTNIVWHGAGGNDRGRDLTAKLQIQLLDGFKQTTRWVVQCKRYISRAPTKAELNDWLAACREHEPDYVLFVHTRTLSSSIKDWLAGSSKGFPYKMILWEKRDLDRALSIFHSELFRDFPKLYHGDLPTLELTPVDTPDNFRFVVDRFEVTLSAFNCDDWFEAERKIAEFLEAARTHSFGFPPHR